LASRSELRALIVLAGRVDPSLQAAMMRASRMNGNFAQNTQRSIGQTSKLGGAIKTALAGAARVAAIGAGAIAAGISLVGARGIKLASDLTEVQNVVDVTFGPAGASQINDWSQKALKSYGLSELAAKQYNGTLGAMMKSSGLAGNNVVKMSENLTGLSGDLSSFYNISQDDAFEKIKAGIAGETEPLRALGINMSVANLEAYALAKGIKTSYQNMDQASQTSLRYAYLMDKSKDAQGDFARTQGGFANQTRLLTTNFNQLAAKVMTAALPALTKLLQIGNGFMEKIMGNPELMKKFQGIISTVFDKIGSALPTIMNLAQQFIPVLGDIFTMSSKTSILPMILELVKELAPVILSTLKQILPTLSSLFGLLAQTAVSLIPMITQLVTALLPLIPPILNIIMAVLTPLIPVLMQIVQALFPPLLQIIMSLLPLIQSLAPILGYLAGIIGGVLVLALKSIMPMITDFADLISTVVGGIGKVLGGIGKFLGLGGKSVDLQANLTAGTIPKFALGGIATSPSIFGDAGPEMAIPLQRTPRSFGLLNQAAQMLGGGNKAQSNGVMITYAPVIYGGNKAEISQALEEDKYRFYSMMEEFFAEKERMAFG